MADLVMAAIGSLVPKLGELLKEEYKLQTGVKERISFLTQELEGAQAVLRKVAEVQWDQLDEGVKIWARHVREASYDMEDVLDTFLVRVQQATDDSTEEEQSLLKQLIKRVAKLWKKSKARRKVSGDMKDIMAHLEEVTERCRRYKVDDIVARPATGGSTVDPRLHAMYNNMKDLVGIDKSSAELISMLQSPQSKDEVPNPQIKIVSTVGVGGLGKTTLCKAVYDKLKEHYDSVAFVSVGRNPDLKKVFTEILVDLDKKKYLEFTKAVLNERQLIDELRSFLENKRYFIVIDDIWDIPSWDIIKLVFDNEKNHGGRIIITTRHKEIATIAGEVYELQPLPYDSSRELLFRRIADPEAKYVDSDQPDEICNKFIRKCGGIPLAIITMASLLAHKKGEDWYKIYKSISFGDKANTEAKTTMRILSYSYYDLPSHLRTCLLYLSAFPEDSIIRKDSLVWKWVAEGFVCKEKEKRLFETGEGYFNDLMNRSMIQAVKAIDRYSFESGVDDSIIYGCRVHDVVLDFIRDMSREENFFTLWDNNNNDEGRLDGRNVRRLAHHNKTICKANHTEMQRVRTVIAFSCVTDTWVPTCRFKLLRVLDMNIELCNSNHGHIEHLGQLLHLRFLRLSNTEIKKIPEEIGSLKLLQTLDLGEVDTLEFPSRRCLPKQLACLRIKVSPQAPNAEVFSVEGLTSLEELSIHGRYDSMAGRRLAKQLSSLTELRVLDASFGWDEETERELVESLRHLDKLQHVEISCRVGRWQGSGFVFHRPLRHLAMEVVTLCKLPRCISPSGLPNLCHLNLKLEHMDDQDLKVLGNLPELYYLLLQVSTSVRTAATISNVSDSDATGYFLKLKFCILISAIAFFGNKNSKAISFHLWNEVGDIPLPCASSGYYDEFHSGDELKSDDKSLGPMTSVVSNDQNKGSIRSKSVAAPSPFMPRLEVLHFYRLRCTFEDFRYFGNLGFEYLSSLQQIKVQFKTNPRKGPRDHSILFTLQHAVSVHPSHPTIYINEW